ncbi:hypothetical protein R1538_08665 [Rhizobium leguminosarum]|uniref:hypothetical protein n=1 Tax=Rhizobium leguminosarum TaxID=384 RepID=UPI00293DE59A|nr:hypothetical protein [Rhizobium leguminosarum]MDV4161193.1 hypothetical protein [Rhizobium leguminosarum]MDV4172031.1 hypothetical protein [Rhizobium leguminosarum]
MVSKNDLSDWVVDALKSNNGTASILYVAKHIWKHHQKDLEGNPLFYSWQYDMRWAATALRKKGRLVAADDDRRGKWTLSE